MNLRWKLFLPLLALSLLASAYISFFWVPLYVEQEFEQHAGSTQSHLNTIGESLLDPLLKGDLSTVHATLDGLLQENRHWRGVLLYDARGRLLYPLERGPDIPANLATRRFFKDLHYLGKRLGNIDLTVDFSDYLAAMKAQVFRLQAVLLAGIVLTLITAAILMEIFLLRPLQRLSAASRRLAQGDYEAPLPRLRHDELGDLITDFSLMRSAIRQHAQELLDEIERRRQAEQSQAAALAERRNIMETVPDSIYILDRDGCLIGWNRRLEETSGYAPEEMRGRHAGQFIHPDDRPGMARAMEKIRSKGFASVRGRLLRRDGTAAPYQWSGAIIRNADGQAIGITGAGHDISAELEAERALQESEARFRNLVETSSDWVWELDADGVYTYASPRVQDILGIPVAEVIGRTPFDLMPADEAARVRAVFAGIVARRAPIVALENINLHRDGRRIVLETSGTPVLAADGTLLGYRGMDRDITLRRQAEEARRAHDAAVEAAQLKSQFLATMSHEIRTPLNGVIGVLSLMNDWELSAGKHELVATAAESAQHLLRLLNDVLDFSKIEAGRLNLEQVDFDPRALAGQACELYRGRAEARGLRLTVEIAPVVPARLRGDPTRLRQVLNNLVDNAIKFTARGEVALSVALQADAPDGALLRFAVRDTGIGIDPAQQAHIFDPFAQADGSTTRRFGGSGLGLAIVRQLAGLMGGAVGVDSTPGAGATFWFTARFAPAAAAPDRPAATISDVRHWSGARVLLVEDNAINRTIAAYMLEKLGCTYEVAADGEQAVTAAVRGGFDLILMDCQMPVLDGYAATAQIRAAEAAGRRVPVVAMTANAMPEDREKCLAAGMDDHLPKPVTLTAMKDMLGCWLGDAFTASAARAVRHEAGHG
jgi:PAS domain S-box-containing protein